MRRSLILACMLLASGCLSAPPPTDVTSASALIAPDGRSFADGTAILGPAQSCVAINGLRGSHVVSDRVIDFEGTGGRSYRVVLDPPCGQLAVEKRFSYATSSSELCAQDVITVLQGSGRLGQSCGLAPFIPIRRSHR